MLRHALLVAALAGSMPAFADEICYSLSRDGVAWSRTPETLCVAEGRADLDPYTIELRTGLPPRTETVATFRYALLARARCMDCNHDVFGVLNPSNSIFNDLSIEFNGKIDMSTGVETGKLKIGGTEFFYEGKH